MPVGIGGDEGVAEGELGGFQGHGEAELAPGSVKAVDVVSGGVAHGKFDAARGTHGLRIDAVAGLQAEGDILGQGENREALEGFDGFLAEGPAIERGAGIHVLDVEDDAGRGEDRHERFPCRSGSGLPPERVRAVGDISCHVRVTVSDS